MRIAIFGVGQLARMMAQAAESLDFECVFVRVENESTDCVDGLGKTVDLSEFVTSDNGVDVDRFYRALDKPDVVTVEKEDVPVPLLIALQSFCAVYPCPEAVALTQDRGKEKNLLRELSIPTTPFFVVNQSDELMPGVGKLGYPVFIKSLRSGYDGKQQWFVSDDLGLREVQQNFPDGGVILEAKVDFLREVSLIAVRNPQGEIQFYPAAENKHEQGVLITSIAPAKDFDTVLESRGKEYLKRLLEHWDYVGALAMECFVTTEGLLVNELAPRVHNSGHWTMQPDVTSQFENHLRAITGTPFGSTEPKAVYGMVNILGHYQPLQHQNVLEELNCDLHWYEKTPKPRRKMGHINIQRPDYKSLEADLLKLESSVYQCEPNSSGDVLAS